MSHIHEDCLSIDRDILPLLPNDSSTNKKIFHCEKCGLVKNQQTEKAYSIGFFINVLANLGLDKVRTRLIAREMLQKNIEDTYGITSTQQIDMFVNISKKYGVKEHDIRRVIEW